MDGTFQSLIIFDPLPTEMGTTSSDRTYLVVSLHLWRRIWRQSRWRRASIAAASKDVQATISHHEKLGLGSVCYPTRLYLIMSHYFIISLYFPKICGFKPCVCMYVCICIYIYILYDIICVYIYIPITKPKHRHFWWLNLQDLWGPRSLCQRCWRSWTRLVLRGRT